MKNIYVLKNPEFIDFNEKSNDLMNIYFTKYYKILELDLNNSINFIKNSKKNDIIIIFYLLESLWKIEIIKYLKNNKPNGTVIFRTDDFWHSGKGRNNIEKYYWKNIFNNINNYKITIFSQVNILENIKNRSFKEYYNNIYTINYWCVYNKAKCEFNKSPNNKILLSGSIGFAYPEREIIKKYKNIEIYNYNRDDVNKNTNNFNLELNKYLCCFTSSIHLINSKSKKRESVHTLLLKVFEILGAGSLLLYPKKEEKYIKEIGLFHKDNCWLLDFDGDIQKQLDYIVDEKNRKEIDEIRYCGWRHGIEKLNSYNKFLEFDKLINNLI
jgi:hypothetical protein